MTDFAYLHEVQDRIFHLDHRLRPEVRAMLCAMASRLPVGGVRKRYRDLVDSIAEGTQALSDKGVHSLEHILTLPGPLPPSVQEFFDKFVGDYGHSSILELTGDPAIFVEDCSWYAAWLAFDSPLCAGQEMSTRAIRRRDWPMAREIEALKLEPDNHELYEAIAENHSLWLAVFENEVDAWKERFSDPNVRELHGISDNEPFRPAFDRARWALPGSIATAFSQTSGLRERARAIHMGLAVAASEGTQGATKLWQDIYRAYELALPGLKGMGLSSAVYAQEGLPALPQHLCHTPICPGPDEVRVRLRGNTSRIINMMDPHPRTAKTYADPMLNRLLADFSVRCSIAVARDWHRHRTMMPWELRPHVLGPFVRLHPRYESLTLVPHSLEALLRETKSLYNQVMIELGSYMAMLVLPFGTSCSLHGCGGLRDFMYTMELRSKAHGTNFEYRAQAQDALGQLREEVEDLGLPVTIRAALFPED